jgi:hypothetical protein
MSFLRSLVLATIVSGLAACSTTQTTSGQAYLRNFPQKPNQSELMKLAGTPPERVWVDGEWRQAPQSGAKPPTFEDRLRQVAAVEPLLRFPARIGLARVEGGRLTGLPADEAVEWTKLGEKLGPQFGSLVPISPLIVEMVATAPVEDTGYQSGYGYNWQPNVAGSTSQVVNAIRLGAARQHVDAVLIYEVEVRSEEEDNVLSWANFTIIGAMVLPGYEIQSDAVASALLIDVRNGYPYGHATANAEDSSMASAVMTDNVRKDLSKNARAKAVTNLVADVETLTRKLKTELASLPPVVAAK